jgi:diguanylate cyclase (GGDEF)-like protein
MKERTRTLFVQRPGSEAAPGRRWRGEYGLEIAARNCCNEWNAIGAGAPPAAERDAPGEPPATDHLHELIRCLIESARRAHLSVALVTVQLDDWRQLVDSHGAGPCDTVVNAIGAMLSEFVKEVGAAARVAADSFLVVLPDLLDGADAARSVRAMLDRVAEARPIDARPLQVTASAGIATFPADGDDLETLLRKSVNAARHGTPGSRGVMRFFSSETDLLAKQRWRLELGLRNAVQRHELMVHYQPQFELASGRVCGVEALARWYLADGNAIGPSVFIPVAERTGLIEELGAWVLELACSTVSGWSNAEEYPPTLCFKVSARQMNDAFCAMMAEIIERSGFPAERLELEITERVLSARPDAAIECLRQWKQLGVRIAIDHFGVGCSSLSYLTRLPVDRLKLDRSLTHSMTFDRKSAVIVRSVIALAKELGVSMLAEGVETEQQLEMLGALGCAQAQGYLFTQPAPAREARALLTKTWGRRPLPAIGANRGQFAGHHAV